MSFDELYEWMVLEVDQAESIEVIIQNIWGRIRSKIHELFNDGYATCTYAVYSVGEVLEAENIPFEVIEGEYTDVGHWWIESQGNIIDLGNNVDEEAIETGKIEPKVLSVSEAKRLGYEAEQRYAFQEFKKYYLELPPGLTGR